MLHVLFGAPHQLSYNQEAGLNLPQDDQTVSTCSTSLKPAFQWSVWGQAVCLFELGKLNS